MRRATLTDIDAMHVVRLAVRENVLSDVARVTPTHYRNMLENDGRGWLCELNGKVVGFGIADATQRSIWALFVLPDHEGHGIGSQLHDAMLDWLFDISSEPVWLTTGRNTRGARFYEAAGWVSVAGASYLETRYEITAPQFRPRRGAPSL